MERINRDRILRIWSLIVLKKGKSKHGKPIPTLVLITKSNETQTIGKYIHEDNSIHIWFRSHYDFKDLTSTILHEYTHYLQFWPWYVRYRKMYSYKENPYEIAANLSETDATNLIREISDEKWLYNISNKKLRKIYESSGEVVKFDI